MKVWAARRAKRDPRYAGVLMDDPNDEPGPPILCGWHLGVNYCAEPPIAWLDAELGVTVILPMGLTDAGSPGMYRWSAKGERHASEPRRWKGAPSVLGRARQPCLVPCRRNHMSRIDWQVLQG